MTRHLVRRVTAVLGTLFVVSAGAVAGAQSASASLGISIPR